MGVVGARGKQLMRAAETSFPRLIRGGTRAAVVHTVDIVHTHVHTYTHTNIHTYKHKCIYKYMHTYTQINIDTTYMHTYYIHTYTQICTQTHERTHTCTAHLLHAHTHPFFPLLPAIVSTKPDFAPEKSYQNGKMKPFETKLRMRCGSE